MIKLAIPLLHVSDPIASESFYCDQLGFIKTFSYSPFGEQGPCYFGLTRDGILLHASSFPEDGKQGNAIVLVVDNVDMRLWEVQTGKLLQTFSRHSNDVNDVSFSPDGKWIASGSSDKTVALWRISNK